MATYGTEDIEYILYVVVKAYKKILLNKSPGKRNWQITYQTED